jgi:oxygen-independent coproporphyrinogen-3 oxidase
VINSLYLHIPFCEHICAYCDFPKLILDKRFEEAYLKALFLEAQQRKIGTYSTIYLGGGTPSALSLTGLEELLKFLQPHFKEGGEWSMEANPESLTPEKAQLLVKYGVNRLSLGIQSSSDKLLKLMNRHHTFLEAKNAIKIAKEAGLSNINADLIYGLPGESLNEVQEDIKAFLSLDVAHLSAYCLSINPGTIFFNKSYHEMDQDLAADQYLAILMGLRKAGYSRYEVSNFAKPHHECLHNLTYWHDEEYMALGLGASGYIGNKRYTNTKNFSRYLKGDHFGNEETVTQKDDLEYFFLTNLRLASGFKKETFKQRFGFSFVSKYGPKFDSLKKDGLLEENSESIYPTDQGILLLDRILLKLYE